MVNQQFQNTLILNHCLDKIAIMNLTLYLVGIRPWSWRAVNRQSPIASRQSPIANRQEESELAARQGKILDLKNLKKNVSHFLVLKD